MYNLMQQMLVSGVGMVTAYQDEHYVSPVTQELRFHSQLVKFYKLAEYTQRHERYNRRMRILCGCLAKEFVHRTRLSTKTGSWGMALT